MDDIREVSTGDKKTELEVGMGSSKAVVKVPMDNFAASKARQVTLNSKWKKEERREVCRKIGKLFYSSGLAYNASNDPYFVPMNEAISNYGPGFVSPTMHELRTWILKAEVDNIHKTEAGHKMAWKQYGCSIMSDGWTDGKSRSLINGELLFDYLSEVIDEVGQENVVQIITDNGSNYVNAGKRLMAKYDHLYWTTCAAHCIDLMLEDIAKLKIHQSTLAKPKKVVNFIYGHTCVLALMRSFTKNQELLRPAMTRFATSYLTLQSVFKHKQDLQSMFSSEQWQSSGWTKNDDGSKGQSIVMFDQHFWGHVKYCTQSALPLVSVLREVGSERKPAMGYIYELMSAAKERIAFNCGHNQKKYLPVWNKVEARRKKQLHKPLHAAGYYLNPQLRFDEKFSSHEDVKEDLYECMSRMLCYKDRLKADVQLDQYDKALGEFGSRMTIDSRKLRSPADWWLRFGSKTPELTKFAIRVLSLTCSASGCERNWSTFERIHTKKRNRPGHKKLNALPYVMYNSRLCERSIRRKMEDIDPILVEDIDSDDEWITEKEEPIFAKDSFRLDEENLFDVDVITNIPSVVLDKENCSRPPAFPDNNVSLGPPRKRRKTSETSSRNEKDTEVIPIDEEELEDFEEPVGRQVEVENENRGMNENDEDNGLAGEIFDSD